MNYIKDIAESILTNNYNKFKQILTKQKFTHQELGHLIVYILPKAALFPSDEELYKTILLEYAADFIIFPQKCRCAMCQLLIV